MMPPPEAQNKDADCPHCCSYDANICCCWLLLPLALLLLSQLLVVLLLSLKQLMCPKGNVLKHDTAPYSMCDVVQQAAVSL